MKSSRLYHLYISQAIQKIKAAGSSDDAQVPSVFLDQKGREVSATAFVGRPLATRKRLPLLPRGIMVQAAAAGLPGNADEVNGFVWVSEEAQGGKMLGEELEVTAGHGGMESEEVALVLTRQGWVRGRLKKVEEVPAFA